MRSSSFLMMLFCICYAPWIMGQTSAPDIFVFAPYAANCEKINQQINVYSTKQLKKIERLERKLRSRFDSVRYDSIFPEFSSHLKSETAGGLAMLSDRRDQARHYIGFLDSFQTALKFRAVAPGADQYRDHLAQLINKSGQTQQLFTESAQMEGRLKAYLQMLKSKLPGGKALRQLRQLQNAVGDYQLKIRYYKETLTNPDKALREAFSLLKKTKVFQQFFRRYSQLAAFLPPDPTEVGVLEPSIVGLQTRELVRQAMYDRVGPNVAMPAFANQRASEWKSQLQQLKNKLQQGKSRPIPEDIQGNPNPEKAKSFLGRLQFGTNLQSTRNTGLLPATTDLGLSIGYKLNAKSILGIGGSYKVGWGENIRHIRFSHQGASLRSFIDWKIKGSFYCSGGYEFNYQPISQEMAPTLHLSAWKKSGLIGISRTIAANHKFFKQAKMQLLWDAFARQQLPHSPSLKIRIGYNIN